MTSTARRRIFSAVFPVATDKTAPTPTATPLIGAGSFGGSFNSNVSDPAEDSEDSTAEKIKWERAWHTATTFLSLPNVPLTFRESQTRDEKLLRRWIKSCSKDVHSALAYLISEKSVGRRLREGRKEDDLMDWYLQEVARHYAQYQMPILTSVRSKSTVKHPF